MDIAFRTKKLREAFNSSRKLQKDYGMDNAKAIAMRMGVLRTAPNLMAVPETKPERRHELKGRRKNQFAVELKNGFRLVFVPANDPIPRLANGGIDLASVTAIEIIEVVDYH